MSNPLAIFRKHQKTMLAVAAVGAMLAFGILPILSDWMGQRGAQGGPTTEASDVAVSWNGRKVSEGELNNLRVLRAQLLQFQQAVVQRTMERGANPRLTVIPPTTAESSIVETLILSELAQKMGIRIGDEAVLEHLTQNLANDTIDRNELAAILRDATGGRLGQQQLFDTVRMELMAHQVRMLANGATHNGSLGDVAISPAQSYEYFKKLNRRMEAELVAFRVEDYLDQVSESPSDVEVKELYDDYKEVFPSKVAPTPGFREPARVAFHWVKADYPTFLERSAAEVTEEEIQAYYEENKSSYKKIALPNTDDLLPPEDDTSDPLDETLNSASEAEDNESAEETGDLAEEELSDDDADSGDPPAERFQDEDEDELEDDAAEQPTTNQAEVLADQSDEGELAPAPDAEESSSDAAKAEVSDIDTTDLGEDLSVAGPVEEYQPLEEVRDDIVQILARPKATDAITKVLDEVKSELREYFNKYMYWDTSPEDEKGAQPEPPSPASIGERLGLVAGEIPLITALEAEDYELGRSYELDFSTGQIRRIPFTMFGFGSNLAKFSPQKISASEVGSQFMFWKVDATEAYTPTLEDAKPKIVRHWKMKKAFEKAKSAAEGAVQNNVKSDSLRTAFADDATKTVIDTGQFTWMTMGALTGGQGTPRVSSVEGVDFAGNDFMTAVSGLDTGGVTVTHNHPETNVYIVYLKGIAGSEEALRNLFLTTGVNQPILSMAWQDSRITASSWYVTMEEELGVKWERPAAADFRR